MHAPGLARAAGAVLFLEGVALVVIALIEGIGLGSGDAASPMTAIALIALTLIGAGALICFALGAARGHSWARSGGVVLQVLAVALALAALTLPPISWPFVLALGVPGIVGFVLLIASARRETGHRQETPRG